MFCSGYQDALTFRRENCRIHSNILSLIRHQQFASFLQVSALLISWLHPTQYRHSDSLAFNIIVIGKIPTAYAQFIPQGATSSSFMTSTTVIYRISSDRHQFDKGQSASALE